MTSPTRPPSLDGHAVRLPNGTAPPDGLVDRVVASSLDLTFRGDLATGPPPGTRHRGELVDAPLARTIDPEAEVLRRALDAVSDGIVIRSTAGAVVFQNVAAAGFLSGRGGPALTMEIACTIADAPSNGATVVREVEAGGRRYELRASRYASGAGRGGALVVIARVSITLPSVESIARRHGFTRREAMVARLLALGFRNDAIAEKLEISLSTARHYTESILVKLGTRSRGSAVALILGTTVPTGEHAVPVPGSAESAVER